MSAELKPCPFCGHEPVLLSWLLGEYRFWKASCEGTTCPVRPNVTTTSERDAVELWNMRAPVDVIARTDAAYLRSVVAPVLREYDTPLGSCGAQSVEDVADRIEAAR